MPSCCVPQCKNSYHKDFSLYSLSAPNEHYGLLILSKNRYKNMIGTPRKNDLYAR